MHLIVATGMFFPTDLPKVDREVRIKIFQAVMPEFARSEVGAFASFLKRSHSRTFLVASRSSLSQDDPLCLPADAHLIADEFDGTSGRDRGVVSCGPGCLVRGSHDPLLDARRECQRREL